jgi:hypothetical protein
VFHCRGTRMQTPRSAPSRAAGANPYMPASEEPKRRRHQSSSAGPEHEQNSLDHGSPVAPSARYLANGAGGPVGTPPTGRAIESTVPAPALQPFTTAIRARQGQMDTREMKKTQKNWGYLRHYLSTVRYSNQLSYAPVPRAGNAGQRRASSVHSIYRRRKPHGKSSGRRRRGQAGRTTPACRPGQRFRGLKWVRSRCGPSNAAWGPERICSCVACFASESRVSPTHTGSLTRLTWASRRSLYSS